MNSTVSLIRTEFATRTADELLRARVTTLLGVSAVAANALAVIGITSVFDLAASRVFGAARRLLAVAEDRDDQRAESRLRTVPSDVVDAPAGIAVAGLASQSIAILRAIGATHAVTLGPALDVFTVRDLALWPPHAAAREILAHAFFPEQSAGFDPEAPADLLPQTGNHPTERVFYRSLLMDGPATDPANATAIEQVMEAVDILPGLLNPSGFQHVTPGALLTFSQSWFSQGLTLGQLLHSTALAPGESTRIAMIDWKRRTGASTTEEISEAEQLSNTQVHNRSLSEVTSASASDFQSGSSSTTANSSTSQTGGGVGFELGPLAFGGSHGRSTTTTDVVTASSSFGVRNVAANYAQAINDRTQQHASSTRSRRASIVREVSQQEHETISTRVVTNYNHMHALTVQYYEVVQAFRVTTELDRAERCLFLPVTLLDFQNLATIERWRGELGRAALTPAIVRALAELGTVRVTSRAPRRLSTLAASFAKAATARTAAVAAAASAGNSENAESAPAPTGDEGDDEAPSGTYTAAPRTRLGRLEQAGWDLEQIDRLGRLTGRLLVPSRTNMIHVTDDALLIGVSLRAGQVGRFALTGQDGTTIAITDPTGAGVGLVAPLALGQLHTIAVQPVGTRRVATSLTLQLSLHGTLTTLDVPVELAARGAAVGLQELVRITAPAATRDLIDHLRAHPMHYTQAVLRSLDGPAVASLLARFTYRGLPLAQLVDQRPVAISANLLVFRMNLPARAEAADPRLNDDLQAWRTFLARAGLDRPAPKTEFVPLPSGGVFAEAVLGRFNSAEKIDLHRFWNWQDSPIPLVAPEIAAVTAGSRSQPDDLTPGQMSSPVVTIQNPVALPDPTAMSAVTGALQNGAMFRNMSGLEQAAAIAQAAQTASSAGATAVAKQAAQNMQTVLEQNTERLRIAAQLAATLTGVSAAGAPGTLTRQGGELEQAKKLDAKAASAAPGSTSAEAETFKTQMGLKGRQIAGAVLEAAGLPGDLLGSSTPAASAAAPVARTVGPTLAAPEAMEFVLQLSSYFTDGSVFGASPVEIEASITDLGGKHLWDFRGPATARLTGKLRTSDERLFLNVWYTYDIPWPQPTRIATNSFSNLDTPAGTKLVGAAVTVGATPRTITVPAGTLVANDTALRQLLQDQGINLRRLLTKPEVTPHAGGGFDIAFRQLDYVTVYQNPAAN